MEPEGGERKGEDGGRIGRVHWAGKFADPEYRRLTFGQGLERQHKSHKRQTVVRLSRGGLWGWDSLSHMAQHAFTMNIACPRIAYLNGIEPPPLQLASLAQITWGYLGIPSNMAFKNNKSGPRQGSGASRAIFKSTQRETATARRMIRAPVASTWVAVVFAMSNVLRMMLCPLC